MFPAVAVELVHHGSGASQVSLVFRAVEVRQRPEQPVGYPQPEVRNDPRYSRVFSAPPPHDQAKHQRRESHKFPAGAVELVPSSSGTSQVSVGFWAVNVP